MASIKFKNPNTGLYERALSGGVTDGTETFDIPRIKAMEDNQKEQSSQTSTLTHGTNIITTDTPSPMKVEFYGNTLSNVFGKKGSCETLNGHILYGSPIVTNDTTWKTSGEKSLKVASSSNGHGLAFSASVRAGKYYIIVFDLNVQSGTVYDKITDFSSSINYGTSTNYTTGVHKTKYIKINPTSDSNDLRLILRQAGDTATTFFVDSVRIIEVSSSRYNEIGVSLTDKDIERMFPYVDSVQHVKRPVITVEGENLLPPFTEWTLHANAEVISPYELKHSGNSGEDSSVTVRVIPNQSYTISDDDLPTNTRYRISDADSGGFIIALVGGSAQLTFTIPSNTNKIKIQAQTQASGTFTFSQPMLNLGTTAKPFVPRNPSYLYAETVLAGNDNKKDISFESGGKFYKQKWFETDVAL